MKVASEKQAIVWDEKLDGVKESVAEQEQMAISAMATALNARKVAAYRAIYLVVPRTEYVEDFVYDPEKKCFAGRMRVVVDGNDIHRYRDIVPGQAIIAQRRTLYSDTGNSFSVFYVVDMDYESGIGRMDIISRIEAATVGQILVNKEYTRQHPIPSSINRHPKLQVWHPHPAFMALGWWMQPYFPIDYQLREYNPSGVFGGNIYIQNSEPDDPNCVWIDTNGIDLIIE
ncbi:MAG: hypothetical protein PHD92_06360 [Eubacteriales bacterium]|nr:hypothetical protein [Eubacteriales bacterium]